MVNNIISKLHLRVLIVSVIVLLSIFFSWKYVNTFIFKSRADAPKYNIAISSRNSQPMVNEDVMLDLVISTSDPSNNHMSAFQFDITNSSGEIVEISQPASILANGSSVVFRDVGTTRITANQTKVAYVIDSASSQLPAVVSFSIKVKPTSNGAMTVGVSGEQVVGDINEYAYEKGTVDTISFNIQPPTSTPTPIPDSTSTPTPAPTDTPIPPTTTPIPSDTPIPDSTSTPIPAPTDTPIPTSVPEATLTPTNSPTPQGNTVLNLKLKFQGITQKPGDQYNRMNVKITVTGGSLVLPLVQTVTFTSDNNGIWSGRTALNLTSGSNYSILVKGPKHIQKKVCDATPHETGVGLYRCSNGSITLNSGDNTLDFSGIIQMSGDLPVQDGIVNSSDLSQVVNSLGKSEPEVLTTSDINLDGIVNTYDYSLILTSLAMRVDEQ